MYKANLRLKGPPKFLDIVLLKTKKKEHLTRGVILCEIMK